MPSDSNAAVRFRVALDLHDVGVEIMRQNLRRRFPHATEAQIAERLAAWIRHRPGAEYGDSVGRLRKA